MPATSFVVSGLASVDQDLAAALTKAGEIASQTTDNSRLVGLPRAEQETRLGRSVSEIADWSGDGPLGLRAPEEAVDAETLAAWRSLGGTYVVGLNNGRTGSPEIFDTGEGRIVLLPRVIKDDYNLLVQDRLRGTAELTSEFLAGIGKIRSIGGLAVMTVSDQLAGLDRYSASISATLDSVRAQEGWWLARGSEVAEWSAARAEASVRLVGTDGRVEVEVAAPARFPLAGGLDPCHPSGERVVARWFVGFRRDRELGRTRVEHRSGVLRRHEVGDRDSRSRPRAWGDAYHRDREGVCSCSRDGPLT